MLRAAIMGLVIIGLSIPAFAQRQERLPQPPAPSPTTQAEWYRAVGSKLQRVGARAVVKATREGIVGRFETQVGFTVSAEGTVSDIRLVESSGNPKVDEIALEFPVLASPFARFTADMTPEPKSIIAPLQLHLDRPAAETTQFIACDNGLRCVTEPCPHTDTILLPSGERLEKTAPDLDRLPAEDKARLAETDGLYYGTLVFEGSVGNGAVVANRIARDATDEETAMCRQ